MSETTTPPDFTEQTGGFQCACCQRNMELRVGGKWCNECAVSRTAVTANLTEQARQLAEQMADVISDASYEGTLTEFLTSSLASFAAEAATAEREWITRIVENMRENGEPDKQKKRLMISVVEVLAAIGDDKE